MYKKKNNKAQISIWIILGVILVASILLIFLIKKGPEVIRPQRGEEVFDIESYLDECTRDYVNEAVDKMLPQGGLLSLRSSAYFNNSNIEYLCYYRGYYDPCINQHPALMREIKNEIKDYITPKVEECLSQMKKEFENKQGIVNFQDSDPSDIEVNLGVDRIFLSISKKTTIEKQGETKSFDKFDFQVTSPLYNLVQIAMEIADQEATYCYFEYVGYSIIYPRYHISLFTMSDSSRIYTISDTKSGKLMNIAIRGCALPSGLPT